MHKSEFVIDNETDKILLDFMMKTVCKISPRRPDQVLI